MTETEAINWIAGVFEQPPEALSPEVSRAAIAAWDSLGVLTLIAELDHQFDITIADGEIDGLQSVGDILNVLRRYGKVS
jgi:acyl carrier protein